MNTAHALAALLCSGLAHAGTVVMPVESGGAFTVPTVSLREARFARTVHQQYDFSCGSAAIATLLTHHYGHAVSEQAVFESMFKAGDAARIKREGFSLLDMKNYLAREGFEAEGYVAGLEVLVKARVPAIALTQENGYRHFVVIKGVTSERVLVGDPSAGTRAMSRAQFEKNWVNGVLFVVRSHTETARFNASQDWRVAPVAPIGGVMSQGAPDGTLMRRGPNDH
jgi:predicted double-glycine peptidase